MRTWTAAVLAAAMLGGCAATEGNGTMATEMRTMDDLRGRTFNRVRVSDGLRVEITVAVGNATTIEVQSDSNLLDKIFTEVERDNLNPDGPGVLEVDAANIEPTVETVLRIGLADLRSVSASRPDTVVTVTGVALEDDQQEEDDTGMESPDGDFAVAAVDGGTVIMEASTCTDLVLIASCLRPQERCEGAGDGGLNVDIEGLGAANATIEASGRAAVRATALTAVDVIAADRARVTILGSPTLRQETATGQGSITFE